MNKTNNKIEIINELEKTIAALDEQQFTTDSAIKELKTELADVNFKLKKFWPIYLTFAKRHMSNVLVFITEAGQEIIDQFSRKVERTSHKHDLEEANIIRKSLDNN